MENFYFLGVDVSKKKLDFCLQFNGKVLKEEVTVNHLSAIESLIGSLSEEFGFTNEELVICAEHTGQYTFPLVCACECKNYKLWLENPSQIKYSSGVQRGKNDKVDAKRIAIYASRFSDRVKVYNRPTQEIERLKQLQSELNMLTTDKAKYQGQLTDQKDYMPEKLFKAKSVRLSTLIKGLEEAIESIELDIEAIISSSEVLFRQKELLQSIEGIGPKVALKMIIETEAFTRFENCRQFCCYAGVAPFAYTSGSSQHSRNKVSNKADKSVKSLLHMAALAVIRKKGSDLRKYFDRKVEEGKNKMTIINAIRAKLVARMFSVIKNNKFYQLNYSNSLA